MSRLLRFLGDAALGGNPGPVKETVLGIEVFDRQPDYDPKVDSVVRTEVRRLRLKLQEYYSGSGAADPLRIEIPKGAYQLTFVPAAETPLMPAPSPPETVAVRYPAPVFWLAGVGVIAIAAVLLGFWRWRPGGTAVSPEPRLLTPSIGQAAHPSISEDGSVVAYSYSAGENSGIFVLTPGEEPRRLPGTRARDYNPALDRTGRRVAFLREESPGQFALLVQEIGGSEAQRWATLARRDRMVWLPDGKRLIASVRTQPGVPAPLMILDGSGGRAVLTAPPPGTLYDGLPTLSPDGRTLAFTRAADVSVDEIFTVALGADFLPLAEPRQVTHEKRHFLGFCFSPDGRSLIASLQRGRGARALWRIPLHRPESMQREVAAGILAAYPVVAPRAGRLVYAVPTDDLNLYRQRPDGPAALSPASRLDSSPAISPDRQWVAFRSDRAGTSEIWVMRIDGSEPRRLTAADGPVTGSPRWSPDGRSIAYDSRLDGNADIFVVPVDGKGNRRITASAANEVVPGWSADGRFLYYASDQTGTWQVWKVPAGGGVARQVTAAGGFKARESADGQWLYYSKREPHSGLWRMPAGGGAEELLAPLPVSLWGGWALSSNGVYYTSVSPKARVLFRAHGSREDREVLAIGNLPVHWDASLDVSTDDRELVFCQLDKAVSDLYEIDVAPER